MGTENFKEEGCLQRDSAEREEYAGARRSFRRIWKERDSAEPELLEAILDRDNLNKAYKRVKANKGAPGIDGMSIEEALPWLRVHKDELIGRMKRGKYTPSPVKRVEIPKPDGGVRKLGIPTVIDRIIQQAISQKLIPIYEPIFADGSYVNRLITDKGTILRELKEIQKTLTDTAELEAEQKMLAEQMNVDADAVQELIAENARVAQDQDEYNIRYEALASRFEQSKARYEQVSAEITMMGIRRREFGRFISSLEALLEMVTEFSEELWGSLVGHMTVYGKGDIGFTLTNGEEIRI